MDPVSEALKRAKQRIQAHGHRQGPKPALVPRRNPQGFTLLEAVIGHNPVEGKGTEAERQALEYVKDAALLLYPDSPDQDDAAKWLEAWNDQPGRTRVQILAVLKDARAKAQADAPPEIAAPPKRERTYQPAHHSGPQSGMGDLDPDLVAKAIALGYEVDNTWTNARLKNAIDTAKAVDAKLAANDPFAGIDPAEKFRLKGEGKGPDLKKAEEIARKGAKR